MKNTTNPIVEDENSLELAMQKQVIREKRNSIDILNNIKKIKELDDGYELYFKRNEVWKTKIEDYNAFLKRGLPFFSTKVILDTVHGYIGLQIRGQKGTKEFVRDVIKRDISYPSYIQKTFDWGFRAVTSNIRKLPDFLIIGAAKCGTTSLYSFLTQHFQIAPARRKEIYFFDRNYEKGLWWYRAHFPVFFQKQKSNRAINNELITGEATPCYLFHPHAPKRVLSVIPNVKLIIMLRNPIERAFSNYNMNVRKGYEQLSFEEAIEKEEERLSGRLDKMLKDEKYQSFNRQHYSYLARGIYVDQLKNWMDKFSENQFLILSSKEFHKNIENCLNKIFDFLNISKAGSMPSDFIRHNYAPYPKIAENTRRQLAKYFEPHNQRLYDFLGIDFEWNTR